MLRSVGVASITTVDSGARLPPRQTRAVWLTWLLALCLAVPVAAADDRTPLARARTLYNQRDFDGAIAAADEARRLADRSDSADLIAARALLERYRTSGRADDLDNARQRLGRISAQRFLGRERVEFVVGLGEALYFEQLPGAAAVVFDSALEAGDGMAEDRDRLLDWWATAVDEDARPRNEFERQAIYQRVRDRMRTELGRSPSSATAAYWSVAAARGQGDLQGAWDAAQAGWVRAPVDEDGGTALRSDLDRLVEGALIPERARLLGQSPDTLKEQWERFKARWTR
jgi:hypothetical protein